MDTQKHAAARQDGARQVASDMSEAVTYLIGVALSAGLGDVARKLSDVNIELQCMQYSGDEEDESGQGRVTQH